MASDTLAEGVADERRPDEPEPAWNLAVLDWVNLYALAVNAPVA